MTTLTNHNTSTEKSFLAKTVDTAKNAAQAVVTAASQTTTGAIIGLPFAAIAESRRDDDKERYERYGQ